MVRDGGVLVMVRDKGWDAVRDMGWEWMNDNEDGVAGMGDADGVNGGE